MDLSHPTQGFYVTKIPSKPDSGGLGNGLSYRADQAREQLAAIVESSDDAIISKDLNGYITSWNRAATRLFGYKPKEMIGQSIMKLIPPELHSEEAEILRRLKAGERIDHYETERLKKTGERVPVSLTISPIRNAEGAIIGASKIARDITERKRTEAALVQSEKLAAIGRMAAAIAHEVNNPLEAIVNLAFLLSHHASLSDEARHYAQMIVDEVSRISHITRQTLSFYRDTVNPIHISMPELLDNVVELHGPAIARKSVQIVKDYRIPAIVWGFPGELRQVMANLLMNSIDALPIGGKLTIRVRPSEIWHRAAGSAGIKVTIADNGTGIPTEARGHLFEPFFTTKQGKGNGLGLWISRGIINKHGGSIRVRTRTGLKQHGTVFTVFLPSDAANGKDKPARSTERQALAS